MYLVEKLEQPNKTTSYKDRTWNPIDFNKKYLPTFCGNTFTGEQTEAS